MLQPGTVLDNKYQIEAVIGEGGFGYVYRARERLTGEAVAIKELVPSLVRDPQMVQRFIQEARATLRLSHPHIARTHGIFHDRGTYYLAMEYLRGGSLADRLKRGPLPIEQAVRVARDLCQALAYAHARGVVHCDIKPANVLFDERGRTRLADFGIAHVSADLMTRQLFTATGMSMGTVRYMAPEQLEGVREDPRVDIYAVGAVLYEMLAAQPYLDFETEMTPAAQMRNIQRIQRHPPRPLRAANPAVPTWLAQTVERALKKVPQERFATADELRAALQWTSGRQEERATQPQAGLAPGRDRQPAPGQALERASSGPAIAGVPATVEPSGPSARLRKVPSWLWIVAGLIGVLGLGCCVVTALSGVLSDGGLALWARDTPQPPGMVVASATDTPGLPGTLAAGATSTSTPRPSRTPTSTPMATPEIAIVQDPFDDNENGWSTGPKANDWWAGSQRIADGKYVWEIDEVYRDFLQRSTPIEGPADCLVSVEVRRITGRANTACYDLVYRETKNGYYIFEVCENLYYRARLFHNDEWQTLVDWTKTYAVLPNHVNSLAVNAVGDHFEFFINEEFVGTVDDDTLSGEGMGIAVTVDEGDVAGYEFDNFTVRKSESARMPVPENLVLQDTFDSNTNDWGVGATDNEFWRGTRTIRDGKYAFSVDEVYRDMLYYSTVMDAPRDAYISVDAQRITGPADSACYGLVYRWSEDGQYVFQVCDDQFYRVRFLHEGQSKTLIDWTESSAIRPGEVNNLVANAFGDYSEFFINGEFAGSFNDDGLSSGRAGVGILMGKGDVAVIEFDNFVLRTP